MPKQHRRIRLRLSLDGLKFLYDARAHVRTDAEGSWTEKIEVRTPDDVELFDDLDKAITWAIAIGGVDQIKYELTPTVAPQRVSSVCVTLYRNKRGNIVVGDGLDAAGRAQALGRLVPPWSSRWGVNAIRRLPRALAERLDQVVIATIPPILAGVVLARLLSG